MRIKDVMTTDVEAVAPDVSLDEAAYLMRGAGLASLPVVDDERLVGVLTARDIIERAVAEGLDPVATLVRDVMTEEVVCCPEEGDTEDATSLMRRYRVRHVFVVDARGDLAGMLDLADIEARAPVTA